jgi:NAD(P)-dependent dehydrogenase (short-subunit alcohol dehydrogenase family)
MDLKLRGATALVVGGSYGIGGAIVGLLAEEGAIVTAVARHPKSAIGHRVWVLSQPCSSYETNFGATQVAGPDRTTRGGFGRIDPERAHSTCRARVRLWRGSGFEIKKSGVRSQNFYSDS